MFAAIPEEQKEGDQVRPGAEQALRGQEGDGRGAKEGGAADQEAGGEEGGEEGRRQGGQEGEEVSH